MENYPQNNNPYTSPGEIYNNTPRGANPQYHYGINRSIIDEKYLYDRQKYHNARKKHSKNIKKIGSNIAVALFLMLIFSNAFSFLLFSPSISKLYENNFIFSNAFYVFYSVISIGIPFLISSRILSKCAGNFQHLYNPPANKPKTLLLVFIGFAGCMGANYITAIIRTIGEFLGIYSSYTAIDYPQTSADVAIMFIATAAIPALIEEYAFRGVILGSLKKYGNGFAIVASAITFAVFHANAVQLPFAFLCGLVLGYVVIATGSIWAGVIIHFLTNSVSCISSALITFVNEDFANTFYTILISGGIGLGILCFFIYIAKYKDEHVFSNQGEGKELDFKTKLGKFFSSVPIVIALIIFIIKAISTLSTTPTVY